MPARWKEMDAPDDVVGRFLESRPARAFTTGARLAADLQSSAGGHCIALSEALDDAAPADVDATIIQAARLFRATEAAITDRLGPGTQVEVDEATWTPTGLPGPVLEAALCTMSLVSAWPLPDHGWCVLEVHQQGPSAPVMVMIYAVAAPGSA